MLYSIRRIHSISVFDVVLPHLLQMYRAPVDDAATSWYQLSILWR